MRTVTGRMFVAAILALGGLALRSTADIEHQIANAEQALATAGPAAAVDQLDALDVDDTLAARVPLVGAALRTEMARQRARATYWLSDYTGLPVVGEQGADAADSLELVVLSANAGFRTVQRSGLEDPAELIRGLDAVLQSYAHVLEEDPENRDTAFNYEFVSLQRILAAGGDLALQPPDEAEADPSEMHGAQGAPPPDTAPGDFNIIVPMSPDERGEFEAGAGGVRQRQG